MKKLRITVNGKAYEVDVEVLEDDELIETQPVFRPIPRPMEPVAPVQAPPPAPAPQGLEPSLPKPKVSVGSSKTLTSPINGKVLEIPVKIGQDVNEKDVLFVVEAMKMKTNISSPQAGRIASIIARIDDSIETGQELLTFE
jgi:biotin carboxyl carrier protein